MAQQTTSPKTLLIVEDNEVEREGLKAVLLQAGFFVREAATGGQALESLRAQRPDLVLLDLLLPESNLDGWAVLDYIRANPHWSNIPVIIVTGLTIASFEWSTAHGALDVAKKPVDTKELLGKIQRYCA